MKIVKHITAQHSELNICELALQCRHHTKQILPALLATVKTMGNVWQKDNNYIRSGWRGKRKEERE